MQHDQFPVLDAIDVLDKIYKMDTPQAPSKICMNTIEVARDGPGELRHGSGKGCVTSVTWGSYVSYCLGCYISWLGACRTGLSKFGCDSGRRPGLSFGPAKERKEERKKERKESLSCDGIAKGRIPVFDVPLESEVIKTRIRGNLTGKLCLGVDCWAACGTTLCGMHQLL